jgi:hypothetical protein
VADDKQPAHQLRASASDSEAESDGLLAPEPQYPTIGEVPEHLHLTACEALCWMGYRRAIPKNVYFSPVVKALNTGCEEVIALLHRSVPDPKPPNDPIGDAERVLMEALHSGQLHLLIEKNGAFEEASAQIYDYAVAVNVRGSIEADCKATERDGERAQRYLTNYPLRGDVWFSRQELLNGWTPPLIAPSAEDFAALLVPRWKQEDTAPALITPTPEPPNEEAKQTHWETWLKRHHGKAAAALTAWAADKFGEELPGRNELLKEHRLHFGVIRGISETTMRLVRKALGSQQAKMGGAPTHQTHRRT